ncbi:MAG: NUDIX domain-containing protein, partial [Planctomycetia bacterium]
REFQRNIWCLEFAFKPPRMIDVDVPLSGQRMQRKRVWYLVYRVRSTGGRRTVIDQDDATKRTVEKFTEPVRFVPHLVLESLEGLSEAEGETAYRSYLDRIVPSAVEAIRKREDHAREILDSASMAAADIPPGGERWGVAVWEDVDPRIDYFSITIRGLTNAVQWRPRPNATFAADSPPGSELEHALESLRLDFWRPGDDRDDADEEMSVGFAGMFERRTLGGRVLEAIERPGLVKSRPASGLDELGLSWADLVAEPDNPAAPSAAADLVPLAKVLVAVGKVQQPSARGPLVKAVFGDLAADWIEQLSKGLFGPAEGPREAARRKAMEETGLEPEAAARRPLESLAKVLESLATLPDPGTRRRRSAVFFGARPLPAWRGSSRNCRSPARRPPSRTSPSIRGCSSPAELWPHSTRSSRRSARRPTPTSGAGSWAACSARGARCSTKKPPRCPRALTTPGFSSTKQRPGERVRPGAALAGSAASVASHPLVRTVFFRGFHEAPTDSMPWHTKKGRAPAATVAIPMPSGAE